MCVRVSVSVQVCGGGVIRASLLLALEASGIAIRSGCTFSFCASLSHRSTNLGPMHVSGSVRVFSAPLRN